MVQIFYWEGLSVLLRKIRRNELRSVARTMADCFYDYPLYGAFFEDDERKIKKIYYFFWYRLYTRQNYTYVSDDHSIVLNIKRPGDKDCSPVGLILFNPVFSIGFILINRLSCLRLVSDFSKMEEPWQKKFYNPETDDFLQAVCISPERRNKGAFSKLIQEIYQGRPIFFETHDEKLLKLYMFMGAKLLATDEWRGVKHYVLKSN